MKGSSKKGKIDKKRRRRKKARKRVLEEGRTDRDKERVSERESQCEYGMNVNRLLNALDGNKNQM